MTPTSDDIALTGYAPVVQVSLVPTTGEMTLVGLALSAVAVVLTWALSRVKRLVLSWWRLTVNVVLFEPATGNVGLNGTSPPE